MAKRERITALKWKRHGDSTVQIAAEQVLAHLELSKLKLQMGRPASGHSTPENERG